MYLMPKPMQPDTFSQYGYASARQLDSTDRGYQHDIYPQYPAAYQIPRIVRVVSAIKNEGSKQFNLPNGLGAFEYQGFTVKYYATPGSLKFKNKKVKQFYEAMRNFDAGWQKINNNVADAVTPLFSAISAVSSKLEAKDVKNALSLPSPTAGVALFLEVAGGGRRMDDSFRSYCAMLQKSTRGFAGFVGIFTALTAALFAASVAIPLLAPAAAIMGKVVLVVAPLGLVSVGAASVLGDMSKGRLPSKKTIKKLNAGVAKATGEEPIKDNEIDSLYAQFESDKKRKATNKKTSTKKSDKGVSDITPSVSAVAVAEPKQEFPLTPLLVGGVALAAVVVATRG